MVGVSDTSGALAGALRSWRDRTGPDAVGLPRNGTRRAPGLRREELAVVAGISVDYVVRLEQGRATAPSAQVCAALSRALQLSDAKQAHLYRLAGHAEDVARVPRRIPASVRRIVEQLDGCPVAVFDATLTLLSWNRLHAATFGDPSGADRRAHNVLVRHFSGRTRAAGSTCSQPSAPRTSPSACRSDVTVGVPT